jgi:hypothetical protein
MRFQGASIPREQTERMEKPLFVDAIDGKVAEMLVALEVLTEAAKRTAAPPLVLARALVTLDNARAQIDAARDSLMPQTPPDRNRR